METQPRPQDHASRRGRKGLLARFRRDRHGGVAIEFAVLAIPFSLLVFAILESCIAFAGQEVMAKVTDDIARQIRTGQLRPADLAGGELQRRICDRLEIMVAQDCPGLSVDLRHFDTFAQAAAARFSITNGEIVLTNAGAPDARGFVVDPGLTASKNMLRVFYRWPVMTDFMAKYTANLNGGKTLHFASVTWQNEPFED